MKELEKYLSDKQIQQIRNDEGYFVAKLHMPEGKTRTCGLCCKNLSGQIYATVYFVPFYPSVLRRACSQEKWYVKELYCEQCGELFEKDAVVCKEIIPSLQKYFEELLKRYELAEM